jgi:putative DNA methylase
VSGRKKLIEVALPLEAINREAALRKRKAPKGYPTTLHKWWAQRPLAACRAVLWASLVDDPSGHPDQFPTESAQEAERQRLFSILEQLIRWENSNNERVLQDARAEILKSTDGHPPPVYDPFCGGGSIPLEAQRLGLEAHASDLNPVAVLITKALIEIPPKFAGLPPVHPEQDRKLHGRKWKAAEGLAEDVRLYGQWMYDEAFRRIGHLYPSARLPRDQGHTEATAVAWLWARTLRCPNPACRAEMPLVRSFALSTRKGRMTWVEPIVDRSAKTLSFQVRTGQPTAAESARIAAGSCVTNEQGKKSKAAFLCLVCGQGPVSGEQIDREASGPGLGALPLAVVADSKGGRIYLPFHFDDASAIASMVAPELERIRERLPGEPCRGTFASNAQGRRYGFRVFADYFTSRQLVTLTTFTDLAKEAQARVVADARAAGLSDHNLRLHEGGAGAIAYADAVSLYLAFAISRCVDYGSSLATWRPKDNAMRSTFAQQAIPMTWDFAEANPFGKSSAGFSESCSVVSGCLEWLPSDVPASFVRQLDAGLAPSRSDQMICTDPPYYDNVSYADLSDFFYCWLRKALSGTFPDLFSTVLVPKAQELIASAGRFDGDTDRAEQFFEQGLARAFGSLRQAADPRFPLVVFYAFRQTESEDDSGITSRASTGWEKMLEALIGAGLSVCGTWPMRTEGDNRKVGVGTNVLASSIVLVCRPRPEEAPLTTRKQFLGALKAYLPGALRRLQHGSIAPVDLAQAAIGPGMAVYSTYSKVIESDGSRLSVRTALQLINQILDEVLAEQDSEFDTDTRWALSWFDQYGMEEGPYGVAEVLSKAKDTSIRGLEESGVLEAGRGKVRLLRREELSADWNPSNDQRLTVWEVAQHLIRRLEQDGEPGAAALLAKLGALGEIARDLAYRLYTVCERRGWAKEAISYNALVLAWPEISRLTQAGQPAAQPRLF